MGEMEREPTGGPVDFLAVTRHLDEGDSLILSHRHAQFLRDGYVYHRSPIVYGDLNLLSDIHRPDMPGRLVSDEFMTAAQRVIDDKDQISWVTSPLLTVINDSTGVSATETLNVARLIIEGRLPIFSLPARSRKGGEMLSVGLNSIVRNLVQVVGVGPVGAVVLDGDSSVPIEEASPEVRQHLMRREVMEQQLSLSMSGVRDESVIALLQMEIAQACAQSRYRVTEGSGGRVSLTMRVGSLPDIRETLMTLIHTVEAHGARLVYEKSAMATGEQGQSFSVIDDQSERLLALSCEQSLDIAIYNAALMAPLFFEEE